MRIVSNTSPMIFLAKVGRLDLLEKLYGLPIMLPDSVFNELAQKAGAETGLLHGSTSMFKVCQVKGGLPGADFLGKGEQQAILLAKQKNADVLLLDDKSARVIADALGLPLRGTLGILMDALKEGLLDHDQWSRLITELISRHDFRISIELYDRLHQETEDYKKR